MLMQHTGALGAATRSALPPTLRLQPPPLARPRPLRLLSRSATSGRGPGFFSGTVSLTGASQPSSTAPSSTEAGRAYWRTLWEKRPAVQFDGSAAAAAAAAGAAAAEGAAADAESKRRRSVDVNGEPADVSQPSTSTISTLVRPKLPCPGQTPPPLIAFIAVTSDPAARPASPRPAVTQIHVNACSFPPFASAARRYYSCSLTWGGTNKSSSFT